MSYIRELELENNINKVVLFQIDKTSKMAKQYSQREFDKLQLGITVEQWILLKILHEAPDGLSQKELADRSLRDPASITRTMRLLQKKGFVVKHALANDKRQNSIQLSEIGQMVIKQHTSIVQQHRDLSTQGFTNEEINTLLNMLKRIQENMY